MEGQRGGKGKERTEEVGNKITTFGPAHHSKKKTTDLPKYHSPLNEINKYIASGLWNFMQRI